MKGRWMAGAFVMDGAVVGTVLEGASGDWFAHGCLKEWEDVKLGSHDTEEEAKRAVEDWVEEHNEE